MIKNHIALPNIRPYSRLETFTFRREIKVKVLRMDPKLRSKSQKTPHIPCKALSKSPTKENSKVNP